ncbi:MAG: cytochrome c maturation protein CcmE [Halopseudomonas yangmingensis]|uniref:Cytochrome c-type biogenesis protein CcmE n=1 Tax=Halopseudomonas yangmingensis TaxID=1720063 RepID=A0A1I4NEQ0_9GAMM|nr:cytochrome c maturation protein CcmE [Halopseudomonas yangmingensis]SFM14032.1 cytochrome c-type biogenesis protein CcmE [Halopseudomonas yangmingensis]
MHPQRKKKLSLILLSVAGLGIAIALALTALQQNINLFYSPTEIAEGLAPQDARIRAGGLVAEGSVKRSDTNLDVEFQVTDGQEFVTVAFNGILPDLFREGQGIVALGRLNENRVLIADEVLAKHDEEYMPPEINRAMEKVNQNQFHGSNAQAQY